MPVPPIPPGFRSITPYLSVSDAEQALPFYAEAFGARERMRLDMPDGTIGHAEMEIGDSVVMLAGPWPDGRFMPPAGPDIPVMIHVYVEDADAVVAQAVAAGATLVRPVETQFYGDRSGAVRCPFGHRWHVATHVEDVPPDELRRRVAAMGA